MIRVLLGEAGLTIGANYQLEWVRPAIVFHAATQMTSFPPTAAVRTGVGRMFAFPRRTATFDEIRAATLHLKRHFR